MNVWTVGHSNRTLDELVALLDAHGIRALADVRTVPRSRRHPHFNTEELAASLPGRGIAYSHHADLGGFRRPRADTPNDGWENEAFRGYADHAMSAGFAAALAELRELAAERPTAVMCAEAVWWRCHRRLIADRLVAAGDDVLHILSAERAEPHSLTEFAVVGADGQITYPPQQLRLG